ncbi:MAG: metallophosphoesterase family protein [Candidatus Latescibacterota bacterium]
MRTAIISDIHANLEALEAVCQRAAGLGVEAWVCLGDIVGYGVDPAACLARVRSLTEVVVLGNHDAAAAGLLGTHEFSAPARRAVEWTASRLSEAERAWLASLPLTRERGSCLFVHAEPRAPASWGYVLSADEAADALQATAAHHCFIGHSHHPFVCAARQGWAIHRRWLEWLPVGPAPVLLEGNRRYLVNVGSVGQSRDGDPRACFVVWDEEQASLQFVRTPYDVAGAQAKIRAAGLPASLAERLAGGN